MPILYGDSQERECRVKARKAKLRTLGIIENSNKWRKLLYRKNF